VRLRRKSRTAKDRLTISETFSEKLARCRLPDGPHLVEVLNLHRFGHRRAESKDEMVGSLAAPAPKGLDKGHVAGRGGTVWCPLTTKLETLFNAAKF
jgi:hypothetical protein